MLSLAEENYLKAIYHIQFKTKRSVSTNQLAKAMQTKPASVTDMIKKLAEKTLLDYQKYQGVNLTAGGKQHALMIVRRHRLWEVFLSQKLNFAWDEVHEVAEELEHIQSEKLINRLDEFLGFPEFDPHGDPIPDANGQLVVKPKVLLTDLPLHNQAKIIAVKNSDPAFLKYMERLGTLIGNKLKVTERMEFDGSMQLELAGDKTVFVSREVAENIFVSPEA